MNHERFQELLLDYVDGHLPEATAAEMKAYIAAHAEAQRELDELREATALLTRLPEAKPAPAVRSQFYQMLDREKRAQGRKAAATAASATRSFWLDRFFAAILPTRPALQGTLALALLVVGIAAGTRFGARPAAPAQTDATAREVAALHSQIDAMGKLITYSLLQKQPTNERLQGVLATLKQEAPQDSTLTDLIGALALDPNVNVRLAALDALAPHASKDLVKAGVRAALSREPAPLAQVAMIDFLATVNDREATALFDQLANNESAPSTVREAARRGLTQIAPQSGPRASSN